jgi:hypothetical protein
LRKVIFPENHLELAILLQILDNVRQTTYNISKFMFERIKCQDWPGTNVFSDQASLLDEAVLYFVDTDKTGLTARLM